jgi:hypothetical protein
MNQDLGPDSLGKLTLEGWEMAKILWAEIEDRYPAEAAGMAAQISQLGPITQWDPNQIVQVWSERQLTQTEALGHTLRLKADRDVAKALQGLGRGTRSVGGGGAGGVHPKQQYNRPRQPGVGLKPSAPVAAAGWQYSSQTGCQDGQLEAEWEAGQLHSPWDDEEQWEPAQQQAYSGCGLGHQQQLDVRGVQMEVQLQNLLTAELGTTAIVAAGGGLAMHKALHPEQHKVGAGHKGDGKGGGASQLGHQGRVLFRGGVGSVGPAASGLCLSPSRGEPFLVGVTVGRTQSQVGQDCYLHGRSPVHGPGG